MTWTDESLNAHVKAWQEHTLPRETWAPHVSHMATTVWHLRRYPFAEALKRMREGILAYNTSQGIADRYHDTVTVVYVHVIADAMRRLDRGQGVGELANEVIAALGSSREERLAMYRQYYSNPDALWTTNAAAARKKFVPPDLKPLPFMDRDLSTRL